MVYGDKFLNYNINKSLVIVNDYDNLSNYFSESYIIEGAFGDLIKKFFNKIGEVISKIVDWIRKSTLFIHEKFNNLLNKVIDNLKNIKMKALFSKHIYLNLNHMAMFVMLS